MEHYNTIPLSDETAKLLKCGDTVYLSGTIYTARDAAHKKLIELLDRGEELPFPISGAVIYYVGPTPAKPGEVIGSAGPTTSYRMDAYTPQLIDAGLRGVIGKGRRSDEVMKAMKDGRVLYFAAIGGAGALLSGCIKSAEIIAFDYLGAEAVRRLEVLDFPVVVVADIFGENLYDIGRKEYLKTL